MITLICVGKKSEFESQIKDYLKRLKPPYDLQIKTINYSDKARESEQIQQIIAQIGTKQSQKPYVIVLDERGQELNNAGLHSLFSKQFDNGKSIVLIIGGAYGVSDRLRDSADYLWSLGQLVLPHQIVRLILAEQIYRTYAIATNHPYHHE